MLLVVCSFVVAVCRNCLVFAGSLRFVCCLLLVVGWLLFAVYGLCVMCCLFDVVCCVLFVGCVLVMLCNVLRAVCLLFVACCLLFVVVV